MDDYLDIEVARFGRDNLQIFKEVEQDTLEAFVPSMLLQPIVENSIKHGLAAKIEGGQITIRTSFSDGRLVIEVEDNGAGIPEERMPQVYVDGIGISNVHERLRVLYGGDFRMDISSREGAGTRIRIEVPELVSEMPSAQVRPDCRKQPPGLRMPAGASSGYWPLLPPLSCFFAVLVDVLDHLLVNQQVRAAEARQLDAVAVVPFHGAVQFFAVGQHHGHRRARLHLLHPIKILRVGLLGRRGLFVRLRSRCVRTRRRLAPSLRLK